MSNHANEAVIEAASRDCTGYDSRGFLKRDPTPTKAGTKHEQAQAGIDKRTNYRNVF